MISIMIIFVVIICSDYNYDYILNTKLFLIKYSFKKSLSEVNTSKPEHFLSYKEHNCSTGALEVGTPLASFGMISAADCTCLCC